ncbi:cation:proton antiporter [Streptomyces sp. NPDC090994]|uniref:cation:proton antiporter domain-containing protein n=1 Tax=Streptomyces sp. NPDC090994 TaxID=3365969 RepID=UPI00381FE323
MTSHQFTLLFAGLALIVFLAGLLGRVCRRIGQPRSSGRSWPASCWARPCSVTAWPARCSRPTSARPCIPWGTGHTGLALLMFVVGMELDGRLLRAQRQRVGGLVLGSIAVPFALGAIVGAFLLRGHAPPERTAFVLFFAVAVSVTAFPVLARILTDLGLHRTELGALALTAAAVGDVVCWAMLTVPVALTGGAAEDRPGGSCCSCRSER